MRASSPEPCILILGATGQVGRALKAFLGERGIALDRAQVSLDQPSALPQALDRIASSGQIHAVINAAAYTQVDLAEKEVEAATRINAEAPGALAEWCRGRGIPLVHFSTDYVFNGQGERPWAETDAIEPLSVYGKTKAQGEAAIQRAGAQHLIFRTSWVYDSVGKNFFRTMARLGQERELLRVVDDQVGAPTYAPDLARAVLEGLETAQARGSFPSGIYHLCGAGETTWFGFAQAIFAGLKQGGFPLKLTKLEPIRTADYPTPARRPHNSRMNMSRAQEVLGVRMPQWKDGLSQCLKEFKP